MTKSIAERVAALRERRAKAGLKRLDLYLPAELHEVVKKYALSKTLQFNREKQNAK